MVSRDRIGKKPLKPLSTSGIARFGEVGNYILPEDQRECMNGTPDTVRRDAGSLVCFSGKRGKRE